MAAGRSGIPSSVFMSSHLGGGRYRYNVMAGPSSSSSTASSRNPNKAPVNWSPSLLTHPTAAMHPSSSLRMSASIQPLQTAVCERRQPTLEPNYNWSNSTTKYEEAQETISDSPNDVVKMMNDGSYLFNYRKFLGKKKKNADNNNNNAVVELFHRELTKSHQIKFQIPKKHLHHFPTIQHSSDRRRRRATLVFHEKETMKTWVFSYLCKKNGGGKIDCFLGSDWGKYIKEKGLDLIKGKDVVTFYEDLTKRSSDGSKFYIIGFSRASTSSPSQPSAPTSILASTPASTTGSFRLFGGSKDHDYCPMEVESEEPNKMMPARPSSSVYPDDLLNNNSGGFDKAAAQINLSEDQHKKKKARWTAEEHGLFLEGVSKLGKGKWKAMSEQFVKSKNKEEIRAHSVYWDRKLAEAANMAAPRKKKRGQSRLYDDAFK